MSITIRPPLMPEKAAWLPLWNGYLEFYECVLDPAVTDATWQRFHDDASGLNCIAAYEAENMVGFVTFTRHPSTWAKGNYCYLEDLFVDPSQRGKGIARKLIEAVKANAKQNHCERVYWTTRESNKAAQALYDTIATKTDFVQYRVKL